MERGGGGVEDGFIGQNCAAAEAVKYKGKQMN